MKNFISLVFLTFSVFLLAQNSPVANDSSFTVNEGAAFSGNLTGSDADSDPLTYTVVGAPTSGTLTIQTNGNFTYTHSGDEGTSDSFTFKITDDENLASNTATVTITITPINDAPTLAAISKTIDEGASSAINVSGNDPEGTILEYTVVTAPNNGTFTLDKSTGVGYYTHNGGETLSDNIVVKATESTGDLLSTQATISITITAVNDAPVSPDGTLSVNEGSASSDTSFGVTDADTPASNITVNVSSQGSNGTVVVTGTNFVYTHNGSETTTDTFTYSTSDGALSSTGTITVTISPQNDAPTGVADTYYVTRNSTTDMAADVGVLRNDTDSDSDTSLFTATLGGTTASFGQVNLNSDGSFTYITDGSNTTFNTDSFSYTVSDGTVSSAEVTVTLEVAEILPVPNSYTNTEGGTLTVDTAAGVISNDIEPNGLSLTASVVANPSYGTLTLNADGSFSYVHDGSENRKDVFTYKLVNANEDESKSTFVVITNTNVNDTPTSGGSSLTLNEGATITFTPTYTDTDTELSGIIFTITTEPTNGILAANLIDNVPDGTFTYTHNAGETTTDSFVYSVSDGEFTVENIAAAITVSPVNDAPTATNLPYTLNEGASQVITFAGSDPEGTSLDFVVLTNPSYGSISTVDGVTTYTHKGSEDFADSFTYASYDGTVQSAAATVSLTITPVNSPPVVTAVAFTINEGAASTFNLASTSTEPEGQTMTYAHAAPTNGSITAFNAATGAITYTHDGTETTSDTFTYTAIDADTLSSASGTVTVTLTPVNDAPVIPSQTLNVDQFDEITFDASGTDAENDALTYTVVTNPTKGELVDNGNGNYTYSNNGASADNDTFTLKANDGNLDSANKELTFTVSAIDSSKPQIILTSASSSITETNAGNASLAINAVLISTDFYSQKRDMKAAAVAVGATNSLGYIYIGEHGGHKYYFKNSGVNSSTASSDAATQEGYLWTIESLAESTAVRNLLDTQGFKNRGIWLGYNYDYSDTTWKWVNGYTLSGGFFVVGSTYRIVSLGDTTQAQWNTTANTTGVTYAKGSTFTAATVGTGTGIATYENFGGSGYNATKDSGGFLERPVVYANNDQWYNTTTNAGAYVLLEYDNNVTAGSDITFAVAATGTATENTDYELSAGTITISSGKSAGSLTLTEKADTLDESSESVILTASTVSTGNAIIKTSKNSLSLNIIDNELTTVTLTTPSSKLIYGEADGSIVITAEIANIKPFDTALTLAMSGDASIDKDYSTDDDGYLDLLASGFDNIRGLVEATSNDFYLAEYRKLYKLEADGTKTALGTGGYGTHSASNQPITQAKYYDIRSIAIDKASARSASGSADVIYIADRNIIRKFDLGNSLVYFITGSNSEYVSTDGTLAEGRFRNIQDITVSRDGNTIYVIEDNKIRTVDLANETVSTLTGHQDWSYKDGSLAEARFEGPRSIAMDTSNSDVSKNVLIVSDYRGLRKVDIENDIVSTLVQTQWGWGDLFIDSSNNMYFTNYDRHSIELYSSDGEYSKVINSNSSSGTVDGVLKDAKISRPRNLLVAASGNLLFQNENDKIRKIDFINKLRIPAGQKTGTFTLNINDDTSYELDETIDVKITSAESIVVDSSVVVLALVIDGDGKTDGADNSLTGHDSAPAVNVVATSSSINETGGSTILTFQLGDAGESGAKQDMSTGNKDNYIFLGTLGDHKYYMSYNSERWTDARDLSTDLGGYLVAIDSSEENTWIRERMTDAGYQWNSAWIGYTDENSEGKFEWANGSDNGYENWSNGEPNNSGGEDYTEILNNGKWNDLPNHHRQFIVEFSGSVSSLPTVITYEATQSSAGDFTLETVAPITIAAGASKATLTIAAVDDDIDEGTDTVTYKITDVTNGTPGSKDTAVVSINDDDNPTVTLTKSANTFIENNGELVITATIDNAKTFASSLGIKLNNGGSDTAVLGKDYQVSELQNVVTFAGSGTSNYSDGTGILAAFDQPNSIVSNGTDIFVADKENQVIRKITSAGVVSTYAGNGNWAHDREEGLKTDVGFARPKLLAFNSAGEMFVFEDGRQRISKIDASGNVTKVIGDGYGDQNGTKTDTQFGNINGMAFDSAGNLFVSDQGKIRKITFAAGSGDASSEAFAGTGNWGYVEGAGTDAEFREPAGIVVDASDNLYVADRHNHRIRKITQSGEVSTFAGDGHGYQDGSLLSARFESPYGLSIDSSGDIFVSTLDGNRIRKIDVSESTVSTVAGSGKQGFLDSNLLSSKFRYPRSILATSSAIYVADTDNHRIRKIDLIPSIKIPAGQKTGTLTLKGVDDFVYEVDETISVDVNSVTNIKNAVSDFSSIAATLTSGDDPPIVKLSVADNVINEASVGRTTNVTVSLSDIYSSTKIDMDASDKSDYYYLGTFKGSKYYSSKNNEHLNYTDSKARATALGGQLAIITSSGEQETIISGIYTQDPEYSSTNPWLNHWIGLDYDDNSNWIWLNGLVSDYENWSSTYHRDDNTYGEAAYLHTNGLWHSTRERDHRRFVVEFSSAVSDSNTIVDISFTDANSSGTTLEGETGADFTSNLISGKLTVPAGSSSGAVVLTAVDDSDDEKIESFNVNLTSVTYDGTTNTDVTSNNTAVVTINDNNLTEITFAVENATASISEVGGQAKLIATLDNAKLYPISVNLAFAESGDLIALFGKDYDSSDLNSVSTFTGSGNTGYLDGDAEDAEFSNNVRNMITDSSGNIYVADMENRSIRKVDTQGTVSTFYQGTNGDDELNGPVGIAFDSAGSMYVAEEWNNRISKIDTGGNLTRFANKDGQWGSNNGDMTEIKFEGVKDVVFDSSDNLYVLENHRIRKIEFSGDLVSSSDFVGSGNHGFQDGTGNDVRIGNAKNLVIDSQNNIYFADEDYQRIRKVTPGGVVTTIAGNGNWDFADGFGTNAKFKNPHTLAIDSSDNIYVSDRDNNRIRKLVLQSDGQYKVSTIAGNGTYGYVDGSADQSQFKQVTALAEFSGTLYAYDRDEYKFRKLLLNPVMSIPVGTKTASFDITAIDDNAYESTENIIVTPSSVGATLKSTDALTIELTSNEATPKVVIKSESAVLNENAGTLTFDVVLVDAGGATSNWTNTELPSASAQDFDYMGEYNGRKYYFSKSNYTWTQAKANAESLGGQMLVIDDQAENDFVGSIMIRNGTWIGFSRPTEADSWANNYGTANFQNFAHVKEGGGSSDDLTGYAVTYGGEWYNHQDNDNRAYILEYGPVASSELESSVQLVYSGDANIGKAVDSQGNNINDYSSDYTIATIAPNTQKTTVTLTGINDDYEENIEEITVTLALRTDPDDASVVISNVDLGSVISKTFQVSDDEEPKVTFASSATDISENGGVVTITASLSNPKLAETTVSMKLEGTSEQLVDYEVSSIFGYKDFVGDRGNRGVAEGAGSKARFESPLQMIEYTNGSILMYDNGSYQIKKIDNKGVVTNFLGNAYNGRNETGDANEVDISMGNSQMVADLSNGDVYWTSYSEIYKFDYAANTVSKLYNYSNEIRGIAIYNNEVYFSGFYKYTINKLTYDGSNYSHEVVIGNDDNADGYSSSAGTQRPFTDNFHYYPSELIVDQARNKMYVNFYGILDEWDYGRKRLAVVDFSNSSWTLHTDNTSAQIPNNGKLSTVMLDKSTGSIFMAYDNSLRIFATDSNTGALYTQDQRDMSQFGRVTSGVVVGGNLYVADYDNSVVGKINLGPSIDIPAGQTTGTLVLSAFKDPWFESDETIDANVNSITNGFSDSTDAADINILESTKLTLVSSPFEGVVDGKVSWGDYDRDGDMDLALMGNGADGTITNVYNNNAGVFTNNGENFTKVIGGDIEFVDVNQDGWLDVAISGNSKDGRISKLYINEKFGFVESTTYSEQVAGLSQADMEWADVDNDSDPDLIISGIDSENNFQTHYYTNVGNGNFFKEVQFNIQGFIQGEIDIVDKDNDGDNDLFIAGISGSVGSQNYSTRQIDNSYYWGNNQTDVGQGYANGNTEYLDIDGDGLMDYLSIGNQDINSTTVSSTSNLNDLTYLPKYNNTDFDFADYNNDGLSDVVISGEDDKGVGFTKLYVTFADYFGSNYQLIETDLKLVGLRDSSVDWIDYDKDGDLDLFLTGLDSLGVAKSLLYKADNVNNLNTPPSKVQNVTVQGLGNNGTLAISWDKPSDDYSTSFRYSVRVGTTAGGSDILYSNSITDAGDTNGSTLLDISSLTTRTSTFLTVKPGTYYVSVQAIDGGNMGGKFSDEVSANVDYAWNLQRLGGLIDRRLRTDESSSIKFMDLDKDGDKDLIGGNIGTATFGKSAINIFAFQNDIFEPKQGYFNGVSSFEIADFNRDGNEDIIVGVEENQGTRVYLLLNTYDEDEARTDGYREYFTQYNPFEGDNLFNSVYNVKFAVKDLDNDGLVDVMAAGESSKISSEATAVVGILNIIPNSTESNDLQFNQFTLSYPKSIGDDKLSELSFISFDFGDIDNDSDFDFLISGYGIDGYQTILYENKRLLDENGAVVQPIEVYFQEKTTNFVSVKQGTTQFVDFDSDGKLDIIFSGESGAGDVFAAYKNTGDNNFSVVTGIGLPKVRNGNFAFGDMFGRGVNDVIYSGTVSGQGTFSRIAYYDPDSFSYVDSGYDLFLDDADIGLADFDGDLDTDVVLTGKFNGDYSNYNYHGYVYMNVRGYDQGTVANSGGNNIKTSSANGVKQTSSGGDSSGESSLNSRPSAPTSITVQRQRIAEDSYDVVISWGAGSDAETPADALTYSLKIGTSDGGEEILASGANANGVRNTGSKGNAENNKSWKITLPIGTYYVAVQSVDASFIGSEFSSTKEFTISTAYKLGDSNGDDSINILDLTSNLDYILDNPPAIFVREVADVNGDGVINVTDISGIVNLILNDPGAAQGSSYDPYDWEYFSSKPIGDATLIRRDGKIFLENDKPVTSLQFSFDSSVEYELSEEMKNMTVVNFVKDGMRTFIIYSYNNQKIDDLTNVIFDYLDLNNGDDFEIKEMSAGSDGGLSLSLKFSDESFFDDSEDTIQIYPNPAVNNINLLTDITKNVDKIEVDIYNVLGVSVYKTNISSIGRLNDLDVSMLSSGVYTVRVRMITDKNEEIVNVHKLIKK